jgi:hypothetical protein
MNIARVFPRRTNATPDDKLSFIGTPDLFTEHLEIDEVHISVTFTWDIPIADRIYPAWSRIAPVWIDGPAFRVKGENFTPGMYLKEGYVITSRGCPNHCWFCTVRQREGDTIRELPITDGYNVLDDNFLACSEKHIRSVFSMLAKQKHKPLFTGGLEASRLKLWQVKEMAILKPKEMFFAYDTPEDKEPLFEAGKLLLRNGFTRKSQSLRAYVLVGYPKDTFEAAEKRFMECMEAGFIPMAMLYRDETGIRDPKWIKFAWPWIRPAIMSKKYRTFEKEEV